MRITILDGLRNFLASLPHDGDYVLPEHAAMFEHNPDGVSYRVKKFLAEIGIKTTKPVDGRSREISVKDVHSLRHTFVCLAAESGIPLPIVQSVVGHISPWMTQLYANHATDQAKRERMKDLPALLIPAGAESQKPAAMALPGTAVSVDEFRGLLERMTDENWNGIRERLLAMLS